MADSVKLGKVLFLCELCDIQEREDRLLVLRRKAVNIISNIIIICWVGHYYYFQYYIQWNWWQVVRGGL